MVPLSLSLSTPNPKTRKILLDPNRPEPRDTPPEHGVAQAVLAAVSCAVAAEPRGGNRCPRPPNSSSLPNFIFSDHPFSHGLGPSSFHFCRSSPVDSAQSNLAETTQPSLDARPVPFCLEFGPERATQFAHTHDPTPRIDPARPQIRPSHCPPVAQLPFAAQLPSVAQPPSRPSPSALPACSSRSRACAAGLFGPYRLRPGPAALNPV
ncbi:hypothetical protein CRG98_038680 [Punica granatum]|uniref:Uncharacterized protein n=1 Tax=Punica granatum TaxID=22663 RepID=A0A2I0IA85_PUNGR|nr:hypothetical protein CRG98_038680 [Punica granatum]